MSQLAVEAAVTSSTTDEQFVDVLHQSSLLQRGLTILYRTTQWLTMLLVAAAGSVSALAQQPARLVMSPVPIWNDTAPPTEPGAFFDPGQNQLVIMVPKPDETNAVPVRYDIPNAARASVDVTVQSLPGKLRFTYTLTDEPLARQPSKRFRLLLPSHDAGLTSSSNGWQFETEATALPDRSATVRGGTMRFISWRNPGTTDAKASRVILTSDSTYLPGFADTFLEGQVKNPLTADIVATLPGAIAQAARQFLEPAFGSTPQTVLAPMFPPDVSKSVIAANYHFGISVLQRGGRIRQDSAYARQLLDNLQAFLTAITPLAAPTLPTTAPTTALEQTIQQALSFCFK